MKFYTLLLLTFLCTRVPAQDLKVFESFTDHAVLQRDVDHPMWGWATPKKVVKVAFGEQRLSVKADAEGRWDVLLPPTPAGGPHRITVMSGKEAILLKDVYFGDVYLLSGQSNMEWRLTQSDPDGVRAKAIADPMIRELKVKKSYDGVPREHLPVDENFNGEWMVGDQDGIGNFSGVGSYFAHYLRKQVDVPIGLLHASWGGSRIEPWMRPAALGMKGDPDLEANKDILYTAGIAGRKRFAEDFPGRNVPTEDTGEKSGWLTDEHNDASWPTMALPTFWEAAGYPNVDGAFYFRRTFTLTAAQAAGEAALHLGAIDDGDYTYVNGQFVGSLPNAYSEPRDYEVKPGVLRAGENTIAIKVVDGGGGGGFSVAADAMKLSTATGDVPLAGNWKFNIGRFEVGGNFNQLPVVLYNAMIAPLGRMPLTGVLWYQGESNAGEGDNLKYADLMKGLVNDWRDRFAQPELPFYWVQLANYTAPPRSANEPGWAVLRQSQTAALALPNTGQAVITDIGEADDIHPKNKWEVGHRLSLHALKNIYGKEVQAASPSFKKVHTVEGMTVLEFADVGGGLIAKATDDKYGFPRGFTVRDKAGEWHYAHALLDPRDNMIAIVNPAGTGITMVRYNWASNPDGNLFSREGLPVTSFEVVIDR